MEFIKGKFGRPIDGYEEMELAAIVERQERMLAERQFRRELGHRHRGA